MSPSKRTIFLLFGASLLFTADTSLAAESSYPVAGTQPDSRPQGAPVMAPLEKNTAWYEHAVTGVESPYPASLQFLEVQGRWYTPFTHPGMTGPYDIRHWHAGKP
jgi:hypothetical protein